MMHPDDIQVFPDHVYILGVRIDRPSHTSVRQWTVFWEAAKKGSENA